MISVPWSQAASVGLHFCLAFTASLNFTSLLFVLSHVYKFYTFFYFPILYNVVLCPLTFTWKVCPTLFLLAAILLFRVTQTPSRSPCPQSWLTSMNIKSHLSFHHKLRHVAFSTLVFSLRTPALHHFPFFTFILTFTHVLSLQCWITSLSLKLSFSQP